MKAFMDEIAGMLATWRRFMRRTAFALGALLLFTAAAEEISISKELFSDQARGGRPVEMKICVPAQGAGPFPAIVFSHGMGLSCEDYSYLGKAWAEHGFVAVHVRHKGSDDIFVKSCAPGERMKALKRPENLVDRPRDISFAIDCLEKLNEGDGPLKGKLDMKRIGVAGHSFGAYTAMAVAGMAVDGRKLSDPRVNAIIEISFPGSTLGGMSPGKAFSPVCMPVMHITGTEDKMPSQTDISARLLPFNNIKAQKQYLIVFDGASHMVFAGPRADDSTTDQGIRDLTCQATLAFWTAFLKDDSGELDRLDETLKGHATLQRK